MCLSNSTCAATTWRDLEDDISDDSDFEDGPTATVVNVNDGDSGDETTDSDDDGRGLSLPYNRPRV
jgi:hypothetical protein